MLEILGGVGVGVREDVFEDGIVAFFVAGFG